MSEKMNKRNICGLDDSFIEFHQGLGRVHKELIKPFKDLCDAADKQGFELAIVSGYRDFERQLVIWNEKVSGERTVLDGKGQPIDIAGLSEWELVQAILRWSALPGASRHHWGTDVDVYDRAAVSESYSVQLTAEEVADDGPFGPLHQWLDRQISLDQSLGFFRPYSVDSGGVAPERWHLSYAPVSGLCQKHLRVEDLLEVLEDKPLALKDTVIEYIDEIYQRYVLVPTERYPVAYQGLLIDR